MTSAHESPVFATTKWTLVSAAGRDATPESRRALSVLCETYWYPLYAFIRRQGIQPAEAQDLTQSFFAEFLEKGRLQAADQSRGRFRSFLLASLRNFMANQSRNARAQKRGGGQPVLGLDFVHGEDRYAREPAHDMTPERIYEQRWAAALLDRTLSRLRAEYASANKSSLFEELAPYLGGDRGSSYGELGVRLNMTEGAVKVAVHRLRKRCGELLRAEIAETVESPAEVEDELRALFQAVETPS